VRDLDDAIFKPHNQNKDSSVDQNFIEEIDREVVCFTMFGKHDSLADDGSPLINDEDDPNALAKIIWINDGYPKYMIRRDSNGRLFNPLGMDEGRHNKFLHHAGKDQYEFRSVNRNAFDHYLYFLKTKNLSHLRTAEREIF
jgi:hypothetical protein